jgi:acid stress-induced BolA-like protein IbaG/YrbA
MRHEAHSGKISLLFIPMNYHWAPGPREIFMQSEQIETLIEASIPDSQAQVEVQGNHIAIVIVSPAFEGLSVVKKQQMVYSSLTDLFADGRLHAVDYMKTFTPEEWQQQQKQ